MSRISRQNLEGEIFHIMEQGINREYIFENENDKKRFLQLLHKYLKQHNIIIYAFCVMDNHVHVLVKCNNINDISHAFQIINTCYAIYYNSSRNRVGYVFRDRYRVEPIYDQFHLENCIKYIHNNPINAGIINDLKDYKFSSYNDYMNNRVSYEIIREIYGSIKDYKIKISGNYDDCNFIEVDNQFGHQNLEDFDDVCKEFKHLSFKEDENIRKVSYELRKRCGADHDKIVKFMNISKSTYYRKIKENTKGMGVPECQNESCKVRPQVSN